MSDDYVRVTGEERLPDPPHHPYTPHNRPRHEPYCCFKVDGSTECGYPEFHEFHVVERELRRG